MVEIQNNQVGILPSQFKNRSAKRQHQKYLCSYYGYIIKATIQATLNITSINYQRDYNHGLQLFTNSFIFINHHGRHTRNSHIPTDNIPDSSRLRVYITDQLSADL